MTFFMTGHKIISMAILYITETSPYSFGNFRKLQSYNSFMPI